MSDPIARVARQEDRQSVIDAVVAAFDRDPAFRYFFDDDDFAAQAATFAGYLFDRRVTRETVWVVGQGFAASLWDGPEPGPRAQLDLPEKVLARLEVYHDAVQGSIPQTPHWYLGVLATHPGHAGRRLGRVAMQAGLDRAASDGLPAYLETTNPGNVELYRRSGFEVTRSIDSGPVPIWVMKKSA
jgi:ribosomal protein S18 acetylase RimI-like enzyme